MTSRPSNSSTTASRTRSISNRWLDSCQKVVILERLAHSVTRRSSRSSGKSPSGRSVQRCFPSSPCRDRRSMPVALAMCSGSASRNDLDTCSGTSGFPSSKRIQLASVKSSFSMSFFNSASFRSSPRVSASFSTNPELSRADFAASIFACTFSSSRPTSTPPPPFGLSAFFLFLKANLIVAASTKGLLGGTANPKPAWQTADFSL
mmetsp:Transcript_17651/g.57257  ORF Transcript_17651/g.57257 Transcript_17651/m.57257 type:complete len:205 (-) Transcript_17651:55-669(-)